MGILQILSFIFIAVVVIGLFTMGFASVLGKKAPKPEPDSADDGPEVDLIRAQLNMTAPGGGPLYWRDPGTQRVLPRPMNLIEVMERYDYRKKS